MSYQTWQEAAKEIQSLKEPMFAVVREAGVPISLGDLSAFFGPQGYSIYSIKMTALSLMDDGVIELNPQVMIVLASSREEKTRFGSM